MFNRCLVNFLWNLTMHWCTFISTPLGWASPIGSRIYTVDFTINGKRIPIFSLIDAWFLLIEDNRVEIINQLGNDQFWLPWLRCNLDYLKRTELQVLWRQIFYLEALPEKAKFSMASWVSILLHFRDTPLDHIMFKWREVVLSWFLTLLLFDFSVWVVFVNGVSFLRCVSWFIYHSYNG